MKEIVIIGAGDFGKETAWLIEEINKVKPMYTILGFLDDSEIKFGQIINGYKCLGSVSMLENLNENKNVCAVVAMQDTKKRKEIVSRFSDFDNWETLIHPNVNISKTSFVGKGCIICAGCNISVNAVIGNHCILNISATVGHDCVIKDYVSMMSGTVACGHVRIEDGAYLGTNCSILPGMKVGFNSKIGAGSVVIRPVKDDVTVMGVPARLIKF